MKKMVKHRPRLLPKLQLLVSKITKPLHCNDINVARTDKMKTMMKPAAKSCDKMKRVDCGLLPPCRKVLTKKIQRSQMIARVWYNADTPNPNLNLDPLDFGWRKVGNSFYPQWYDGPALPSSADSIILELYHPLG